MNVATAPSAAVATHRQALEAARRLSALQVNTVAHAVTGLADEVGWARLTELGTAATVRAQESGVAATIGLLSATLDAAGLAGDIASLPGVEPGRLRSGRDVRGMFDVTRGIVQARMGAGAEFPEALDASATVLTAVASSEPHRIARDGQFNTGLSDERFNRYRRVAVGDTCPFCLMLATRGAVYLTAESAGRGRRFHYRCDCYVELVVDPAAIEASKGLQKDWRNAVTDADRLNSAGARSGWADLDENALGQLSAVAERDRSAALNAEIARRATPSIPPPVAARADDVLDVQPHAPALDAESARSLKNADLEAEMKSAWDAEDWDRADILEAEVDRRQKWADGWGHSYDDYDDFARPVEHLDDVDLPDFEDIEQPPRLTRREVRAQWEAEQETRMYDAESYGAGILPELRNEARSKGITLQTLMNGDPRTAYKYANQELLQWWADNGGRRPLWEIEAAHGRIDGATLTRRRMTEGKARALAQDLLGKNRREAMAQRAAEVKRLRRRRGI